MDKHNSLNRKKLLTLVTIIVTLAILVTAVFAVEKGNLMKTLGQNQKNILADVNDSSQAVAVVNGEKITKKGFDTYKLMVNEGGKKVSDKEILDQIISRQLLYQDALNNGVTVSDDKVTEQINSSITALKSDKDQYNNFTEYISGLGMSEEQYWESVRPVYKKALIIGEYKNSLKKAFKEKNKIGNDMELNTRFSEYYKNYINDLKGKAKIEYYIN